MAYTKILGWTEQHIRARQAINMLIQNRIAAFSMLEIVDLSHHLSHFCKFNVACAAKRGLHINDLFE
jgi:hypothetical protein